MSIKQTQNKLFGGRQHGVSQSTGVNFPDIEKIAAAFGIDYINIRNNDELDYYMEKCMRAEKPFIVELWSQHELDVQPAQAVHEDGTQGGLHDMSPFLSEQELEDEMIVKI
jgi:acetolactate synthase-1/2/3 large subunit